MAVAAAAPLRRLNRVALRKPAAVVVAVAIAHLPATRVASSKEAAVVAVVVVAVVEVVPVAKEAAVVVVVVDLSPRKRKPRKNSMLKWMITF